MNLCGVKEFYVKKSLTYSIKNNLSFWSHCYWPTNDWKRQKTGEAEIGSELNNIYFIGLAIHLCTHCIHVEQSLATLANRLSIYLVFGVILDLLWPIFTCHGANFLCYNRAKLSKPSVHLVTLFKNGAISASFSIQSAVNNINLLMTAFEQRTSELLQSPLALNETSREQTFVLGCSETRNYLWGFCSVTRCWNKK